MNRLHHLEFIAYCAELNRYWNMSSPVADAPTTEWISAYMASNKLPKGLLAVPRDVLLCIEELAQIKALCKEIAG